MSREFCLMKSESIVGERDLARLCKKQTAAFSSQERTGQAHVMHMAIPLVQQGPQSLTAALARRLSAGQYSAIKQEQNTLASPSSVMLFTAWAAKHKEVLAIEDRWNLAVQHDPAAAGAIHKELENARVDAQRMLAQAQSRFHEEQRARE